MKGLMNLFTLVCAPAESETNAAAVRHSVFLCVFFYLFTVCCRGDWKETNYICKNSGAEILIKILANLMLLLAGWMHARRRSRRNMISSAKLMIGMTFDLRRFTALCKQSQYMHCFYWSLSCSHTISSAMVWKDLVKLYVRGTFCLSFVLWCDHDIQFEGFRVW